MAEAQFNRTLRCRQMETRVSFDITGEYVTVPNDWLEFRWGYIESNPRKQLAFMPSETQTRMFDYTDGTESTEPVYFSIVGNSFRFAPRPSATSATIVYYAQIPPLSLNATNWLLTYAPDLYLAGSMLAAAMYIQNIELTREIQPGYAALLSQVQADSNRARSGPGMVARPG